MTRRTVKPATERRAKLELMVDLTPDELTARGESLAQVDKEIDEKKEDARSYASSRREEIKTLKEEQEKLVKAIDTGSELQMVDCIIKFDLDRNTVLYLRAKDGVEVKNRVLEPEEREALVQGQLPNIDDEPAATNGADDQQPEA
jgi:hypothetical protein